MVVVIVGVSAIQVVVDLRRVPKVVVAAVQRVEEKVAHVVQDHGHDQESGEVGHVDGATDAADHSEEGYDDGQDDGHHFVLQI